MRLIRTPEDLASAAGAGNLRTAATSVGKWLPSVLSSRKWDVHISPHILLLYYQAEGIETKLDPHSLLNVCESYRNEIRDYFHIDPTSKLETQASKSRLMFVLLDMGAGVNFGSLPDSRTLVYLLDTKHDPAYLQRFRHELAHWVWSANFGEVPALFNEGIAVCAEILSSKKNDISALVEGLREIDNMPNLSEVALTGKFWSEKVGYRVAGTVVHYLTETWGWEPLKEFSRNSDYADVDVGLKFKKAFGVSLDEI